MAEACAVVLFAEPAVTPGPDGAFLFDGAACASTGEVEEVFPTLGLGLAPVEASGCGGFVPGDAVEVADPGVAGVRPVPVGVYPPTDHPMPFRAVLIVESE